MDLFELHVVKILQLVFTCLITSNNVNKSLDMISPSVCVFSPVTKTSSADQQDFELLAQCRINREALCVALNEFEFVQAH